MILSALHKARGMYQRLTEIFWFLKKSVVPVTKMLFLPVFLLGKCLTCLSVFVGIFKFQRHYLNP